MKSLEHEKISVIIPAAGKGKRMGMETPKPFLLIRNKPVLWFTLNRFLNNPYVEEIILVVSGDLLSEADLLVKELKSPMPVKITEGGAERQNSVWEGIKSANEKNSVILVHDAVRPFFAPSVIHDGLRLLKTYQGAAAGVPVVHTIKRTEGNMIRETVPREDLIQIHTPQIFHASVLKTAFKQAFSEGFYGTDECMLAERYGYTLALIPDTPENIKLTTPFDLQTAEILVTKYETAYWPGL
jgi:2-C-methyl-D-erythritol 4-phosphate cytidylyltransferase